MIPSDWITVEAGGEWICRINKCCRLLINEVGEGGGNKTINFSGEDNGVVFGIKLNKKYEIAHVPPNREHRSPLMLLLPLTI